MFSVRCWLFDVSFYFRRKNSIPATTDNPIIHKNHLMPRGLTGSGPNSLFTNSSWAKFSSGNPRWLAYAVSDQPVCSSEPHSGQALALRGTSAPQFGQTSGVIMIYARHPILPIVKECKTRKSYIANRKSSPHTGIFLVGFQPEFHQNVIVGNGLHVLDVVFQAQKLAETKQGEHLDGRRLFANEFGLDLFQTDLPRDFHDLADERPRQTASPKFRMNQHTDAADMPLPAAELLVQRGVAGDFAANQPDQRQIAPIVNVPAPVTDGFNFRDAMFDEHPFRFGDTEKQTVKFLFIVAAQWAQCRFRAVLELDDFGEPLEFKFNAK